MVDTLTDRPADYRGDRSAGGFCLSRHGDYRAEGRRDDEVFSSRAHGGTSRDRGDHPLCQ